MKTIKLDRPTAEQVTLYNHIMSQNIRTDRKKATKVLQKWMDGKLEVKVKKNFKPTSCDLCLVGCCVDYLCNPACIAVCLILKRCKK
ncbi:MAG: hypothetical protein COB07_10775 [Sulfurovum sp.]|nr:MAG: hypothetical protein COB07_10775 [Sulfurovum sp.]